MTLYFLRHGEAGMNFPSDFDRELTDEGIKASQSVGEYCKKTNIELSHIITSPLIRAKQTVKEIRKYFRNIYLEETGFLTPDSDPKNLYTFLSSFTNNSKILIVTHEPFASTFISTLISGSESVNIVMKTTSIACVETHGAPVRGNGKLQWLLSSDMIQHFL